MPSQRNQRIADLDRRSFIFPYTAKQDFLSAGIGIEEPMTAFGHQWDREGPVFCVDVEHGPQFPLPLMSKDFRLILDLARKRDVQMPATSLFLGQQCCVPTEGEEDFSAVMRYMENLNRETQVATAIFGGLRRVSG